MKKIYEPKKQTKTNVYIIQLLHFKLDVLYFEWDVLHFKLDTLHSKLDYKKVLFRPLAKQSIKFITVYFFRFIEKR